MAVAAARTGYILYERHAEQAQTKPQPPPLNADYYVVPKKLHPYDLKSAKQLTQQPAWVEVGYSIAYFPYDTARRKVEFSKQEGQLLPLEKLDIRDVITAVAPSAADQKQVMAVFEKDGREYAFSIGAVQDGSYSIYSDDMLFIEDPHQLYKHWPAEVWNEIDKHEVEPGMSELEAGFALGVGYPEGEGTPGDRTLDYPNGGKPMSIRFENGRAVEIQPGKSL